MTPTSAGALVTSGYTTDPRPSPAPAWFLDHTATTPSTGQVLVEGACIRFLEWRPAKQTRETLLLVHGGAANAQWWAPLAPFFVADGHRVVTMDLSGMGLSDWRAAYDVEVWAQEVVAVADRVRTDDHAVAVIAHSLGGIIGATASVSRGDAFARFVAVDSPVWNHAPAPETPIGDRADAPVRLYPDPEVAIARFTLIPQQEVRSPWFVRHVAWHGLGHVEGGGWTWRFDRHIFEGARGENRIARFAGDLGDAGCPWAVVVGEESYLAPTAREFAATHDLVPKVVLVPRAQHHVMLDDPLALVATLRGLLAAW